MQHVLEANNLNISYQTRNGLKHVVRDVTLSLDCRQFHALVGGSGCGKTTLCKSLIGLNDKKMVISGQVSRREGSIAMVFQDPYLSLDPSQSIGKQVEEAVLIHMKKIKDKSDNDSTYAHKKSLELLNLVGIDNAEIRYDHIPMSFSGGMRQRVAIAIALAMEPELIIADELTSSLDEENKGQILALLKSLSQRLSTAVLLVTHDLGLVKDHCDYVMVMNEGQIVEEGTVNDIFHDPQSPYTESLVRYAGYGEGTEHTHGDLHFHHGKVHSHQHKTNHQHNHVDSAINRDERLEHIPHLVEIKDLSKNYKTSGHETIEVFNRISLNIHKGELLGISGKSGIGKTTLAKCVVGLEKPDSGSIRYSSELNRKNCIQMVFQDSKSALNPRMTVGESIYEAVALNPGSSKPNPAPKSDEVRELLQMVELAPDISSKRPYEISGGQRQRVAIARALAMNPQLLIADEPISSLDMAVQAQMIHLIKRIQKENQLTVMLISHDIPMLMHVCDRIIVIHS